MAPQNRVPHFDIEWTLRHIFGKPGFRPIQKEIIWAALNGEDIFVQAATSFGKSLCFQLPAVVDYGITIVISPLLALMNNQVESLRAAKVAVESINSTTPKPEKNRILKDLKCGHPRTKLLYVTPEYCALDYFRKILRLIHEQQQLSRIAVDEAHCVSEWGHDFRPSFQALSFFRRELGDVPIMCCTATATQMVRDDIIRSLDLNPKRLKLFTMTTSRPNIHYEVRFKSDEADHYDNFLKWIKKVHSRRAMEPRNRQLKAENRRITNFSGIIYTLFRKDCEILAGRLREDGIGAKPYHAGLTNADKDATLAGWVDNKEGYDVIVATTAFGMGINKEDVRFVVHWQIPKTFEGFYQEAGRAGRDGKASISIVYYSREDRDRAMLMFQRASARIVTSKAKQAALGNMESRRMSLQALIDYCESTDRCRHKLICKYFGEQAQPVCDWACDFHKDPIALRKAKLDGLASEEWCSTQMEMGGYAIDDYD